MQGLAATDGPRVPSVGVGTLRTAGGQKGLAQLVGDYHNHLGTSPTNFSLVRGLAQPDPVFHHFWGLAQPVLIHHQFLVFLIDPPLGFASRSIFGLCLSIHLALLIDPPCGFAY